MYHGEDVCLSHVEDFWRECISRTANTDGPHLFYSRKKEYTSLAVCGSAIQMKNAWCFSVWADSLACEPVMCDISFHERQEKIFLFGWLVFSLHFHLLLLHHYDNVGGPPGTHRRGCSCFSGTGCAMASCQFVSECSPAAVTVSQQGL